MMKGTQQWCNLHHASTMDDLVEENYPGYGVSYTPDHDKFSIGLTESQGGLLTHAATWSELSEILR